MNPIERALAVAAIVVATGCGVEADADRTPATHGQVASYELLVGHVQAEAASYHAAMSPPEMTTVMCQSIHDDYHHRQQGWLSQMMPLGGPMDDLMAEHGGMMNADNGCIAAMLMDELDHHHAVACSAGDWADDRHEGLRHAEAMGDYASWASDRCQELMAGFEGEGWHFGPMTGVCEAYDGDCGDAGHHDGYGECCGGMMHCGP